MAPDSNPCSSQTAPARMRWPCRVTARSFWQDHPAAALGRGPDSTLRLNVDGTPDTTFGQGGKATFPIAQGGGAAADDATGVAIEATGKIVVVGTSPTSTGTAMTVLQLTSTGALDPSFGSAGVKTISFSGESSAGGVALQSDGEILVSGFVEVSVGTSQTQLEFGVARLAANGALDTSFGDGGLQTISSFAAAGAEPALALQPDGKIILAGNEAGLPTSIAAVRLNANGTLDSTFGTGGVQILSKTATFAIFVVSAVGLQPDGRIVIVGGPDDTGGPDGFDVIRLNASGGLDTSFNQTGELSVTTTNSFFGFKPQGATAVDVQPDGQIVVAGSLGDPSIDFELARIDSNGTLDQTFGNAGLQMVAFNQHPGQLPAGSGDANALALTTDGKLVVAGLAQIPDGSGLDSAF